MPPDLLTKSPSFIDIAEAAAQPALDQVATSSLIPVGLNVHMNFTPPMESLSLPTSVTGGKQNGLEFFSKEAASFAPPTFRATAVHFQIKWNHRENGSMHTLIISKLVTMSHSLGDVQFHSFFDRPLPMSQKPSRHELSLLAMKEFRRRFSGWWSQAYQG